MVKNVHFFEALLACYLFSFTIVFKAKIDLIPYILYYGEEFYKKQHHNLFGFVHIYFDNNYLLVSLLKQFLFSSLRNP